MKADYSDETKKKNADKDKRVQATIYSLKTKQLYTNAISSMGRDVSWRCASIVRYPFNNNYVRSSRWWYHKKDRSHF